MKATNRTEAVAGWLELMFGPSVRQEGDERQRAARTARWTRERWLETAERTLWFAESGCGFPPQERQEALASEREFLESIRDRLVSPDEQGRADGEEIRKKRERDRELEPEPEEDAGPPDV